MYLKQLSSGTWRYIVQHRGQKATGTALTRALAQQAGAQALLELGTRPVRAHVTVGDLLSVHLESQPLAATTLADFQRIVDKLPEHVLRWAVREVEPVVVQAWYRSLAGDGWSAHRVRKLHTLLSSAWGRAVTYEWATRNVLADVRKPQVDTPDVRPPTTDEIRRVIEATDGKVSLYLRVAAMTGMRRGEACGLQWGDVALDSGEVVVRRSTAQIAGRMGTVVSEGKTGRRGHRVVALDAATIDGLRLLRRQQVEVAVAHGLPSPLWVWSHDAGVSPWRGDYISREFRRACAKASVLGVRLHDLRHYMATAMLSAGVPVSVVAHRLGHSSPTVTYGVYAHYVRADDGAAADALGNVL